MARKRSSRRMHSEDAKFLRDLLVTVLSRVDEVEAHTGHIQERMDFLEYGRSVPVHETIDEIPTTEVMAGE